MRQLVQSHKNGARRKKCLQFYGASGILTVIKKIFKLRYRETGKIAHSMHGGLMGALCVMLCLAGRQGIFCCPARRICAAVYGKGEPP